MFPSGADERSKIEAKLSKVQKYQLYDDVVLKRDLLYSQKKKNANERTRIWRLMAGSVVYSVGRKSAWWKML